MKLLTQANIKALQANPLYSGDGKPAEDRQVLVKFFTPWSNWTWYVLEGEQQEDGDWSFFGLVEGHESELGYFNLSQLEAIKDPFRLKIERDRNFSATLAEVQHVR